MMNDNGITTGEAGKTIMTLAIIIVIVTAIAGYSYFETRTLIKGPQVSINTPRDGETLKDPLVDITGTAGNISYLSLNDRQIYVDDKGNFNEQLLLSPGYNVWTLQAKDKFGRTVSKKLELIFNKS